MRLGVFGSYNSSSLGDHAILEGVLRQFDLEDASTEFTVFSFSPNETRTMLERRHNVRVVSAAPALRGAAANPPDRPRETKPGVIRRALRRMPALRNAVLRCYCPIRLVLNDLAILKHVGFWRRTLGAMRQLDLLLIGGGNLLMDVYRGWPVYPLLYSLVARLARIPVMYYAVGFGPIETCRGRLYLWASCHIACQLTFRDRESLDLARRTLWLPEKKLHLSADPAVSLLKNSALSDGPLQTHRTVGITVVPYYSPRYWPSPNAEIYGTYIDGFAKLADAIIEDVGFSVVFIATNIPNDVVAAEDVVQRMRNATGVRVLGSRSTTKELIAEIGAIDLLIGTRLHSVLLSMVAGTPFAAIPYQPKVSSFCSRIGMAEHVISIDQILKAETAPVINQLKTILILSDSVRMKSQAATESLRQSALLSRDLALSIIRGDSQC